MKKVILLFCFAFALSPVLAQKTYFDSLRHLLLKTKTDPARIGIISELIKNNYGKYKPDSSIFYGRQLIAWGKAHHNKDVTATGLHGIAFALYDKGNYPGALDMALQELRMIENGKDTSDITHTYNLIGTIYKGQENYPKALYYYTLTKQLALASYDQIRSI